MSPESEHVTATAGARSPSDQGSAEPNPAMVQLSGEDTKETPSTEEPSGIDSIKFDGKILYNPDGSTYIIEDQTDLADNDLPRQEGCIVSTSSEDQNEDTKSYPQIANAFVVSRSSAYYNTLYGQAVVKLLPRLSPK